MNVRVKVLFETVDAKSHAEMTSMARVIADCRESVRVFPDSKPNTLVAEFTMKSGLQIVAVDRIDDVLRDLVGGCDSTIQFPRTPDEEARAKRKNAQARARRRANRTRFATTESTNAISARPTNDGITYGWPRLPNRRPKRRSVKLSRRVRNHRSLAAQSSCLCHDFGPPTAILGAFAFFRVLASSLLHCWSAAGWLERGMGDADH